MNQTQIEIIQPKKEINWEAFKSSDEYLKILPGQKVKVSFLSVTQSEAVLKEKDSEGRETERRIPSLEFVVDSLDGKPVKMQFSCTSKKLIAQFRRFDERDLLFSNVLEIEKSGVGVQTQYQVFDCGKKA